jgi:hypothetical protein
MMSSEGFISAPFHPFKNLSIMIFRVESVLLSLKIAAPRVRASEKNLILHFGEQKT